MTRLLSLLLATVLAWAGALAATPPPDFVEATPQTDVAYVLADAWTFPMTPEVTIRPPMATVTAVHATIKHDQQARVDIVILAPVPTGEMPVDVASIAILGVDGTARLEWQHGGAWVTWPDPIPITDGTGWIEWKPGSTATYRVAFGNVATGVAYTEPFTVEVQPPPPPRRYAKRDYGPLPELRGPILLTAAKYIGVPYVWGGESMSGMDCSGFVQTVYGELGVGLPRTTDGIYRAGTVVSASEAQPGDVLYWSHGHVALYVAPGWRLDANRPGSTIQIRPIYGTPTYVHIG